MWKEFFELLKQIITLGKELDQNRADMKEMRRDLLNLTLVVQRLSDEIKMNSQKEGDEREKNILRLQNELLKFEKMLPPKPKAAKPTKKK
jgi:hypothetical protein